MVMEENMNKRKLDWIDVSKGICILLMIVGHTIKFGMLRTFIFSFHMPLFFILSGYTFKEKVKINVCIKKSFKRLIIPYIITCVIMFPLVCINALTLNELSIQEILKFSLACIYANGAVHTVPIDAIGAIWFLVCLFFARIFFNIFMNFTIEMNKYIKFILISIISTIGIVIGKIVELPGSIDIALSTLIFMYIGFLLKTKQYKINTISIICLVAVWITQIFIGGIELASRRYFKFPLCIIGAIAGSIIVFILSSKIKQYHYLNKYLCWCGENSLTILCVHKVEATVINWNDILSMSKYNIGVAFARIILDIILLYCFLSIKKFIIRMQRKKIIDAI